MSDTITTSDGRTVPLDGLAAAARAATPGPVKPVGASEESCWLLPDCFPRDCWITVKGCDRIANAAHIAAFDRETCLALVAEVRRLRECNERQRQSLAFYQSPHVTMTVEYADRLEQERLRLRERVAELEAEDAKLRADLAAARADDFQVSRLLAWLRDPERKEPALAFTAGVLRGAADEVVMMLAERGTTPNGEKQS